MTQHINSRLGATPERDDPQTLARNSGLCSQGTIPQGAGFLVAPDEYSALILSSRKNKERLFPFIGGEEVVNTPRPNDIRRYIISFGAMELDEAETWPQLLSIVRERVKPERDKLNARNAIAIRQKKYWWRFWAERTELYEQLQELRHCLVTPQTSKHRVFARQPTGRVFAQTLVVFPLDGYEYLALLQSRLHEAWSVLLSSSMKQDVRYIPSDCFGTFPFPNENPREAVPKLASIGGAFDNARTSFMLDRNLGLTQTYNALKDPECTDSRIEALRRLHETVDRAVLDAYGWSDIEVPPYGTHSESFNDEILDRLHALNTERAKEQSNHD